VLLLLAGYAGLTSLQLNEYINDKALHFLTFFALTIAFYWILDTNRRRTLNLTLVVCTAGLGLGSEIIQWLLPNGRVFDLYDVVANVVGSLAGLGLCSWYHKRMVERKRQRRGYGEVPGEDGEDLELGEGLGPGHEEGVTTGESEVDRGRPTLEQAVENWDENAVDEWDEDDGGDVGVATTSGKGKEVEANGDHVKRSE